MGRGVCKNLGRNKKHLCIFPVFNYNQIILKSSISQILIKVRASGYQVEGVRKNIIHQTPTKQIRKQNMDCFNY